MLKFKIQFEIEEEAIKDIFESYNKKFTKKKLAELKADLKENAAYDDFAYNLRDEVENLLGEWIDNLFEDEE